ncbi:MAG: hypothetical protein IKS99_00510 [Firmicutes bacterium]|nr:hypothetical protein [Bacillota bacterium]
MKKLLIIMLCIAVVFTFTACGGDNNEGGSGGESGGEIIFNVAVDAEYDTLNPFKTEMLLVCEYLELMYDSLIGYDEDYNPVPKVAESWETDGNDWIFHLRDDVYFSDGEKLTSADVKYTYEAMADSYVFSIKTYSIDSIETPDDTTVIFHCSCGKPDMLIQNIPIVPAHVWSEQEDILSYETTDIVGSGPFIYSAERSGPGTTAFVKNENYWGQQPTVDVVVFSQYDTYDTMAQALAIGEVDACYQLDASVESTIEQAEGIDTIMAEQISFDYLGYNLCNELLADQTIRYAMDYCFDHDQVIEMAYYGLGRIAYGPVNNEGYEYIPDDSIRRDFSIDKANELLDAAGIVDTDGDGIREKDGKPLSFVLTTASEKWSWQQAAVNMVITNCGKAGIKVESETINRMAMWDKCYDGSTDFDMFMDGWAGDSDPCYMMSTFIWYGEGEGYTSVNYHNEEFDKYYYLANEETDVEKRKEYIHEALEILYIDCPYTFQEFDTVIQAVNGNKWTGYTANSRGIFANERNDVYINIKPVE